MELTVVPVINTIRKQLPINKRVVKPIELAPQEGMINKHLASFLINGYQLDSQGYTPASSFNKEITGVGQKTFSSFMWRNGFTQARVLINKKQTRVWECIVAITPEF